MKRINYSVQFFLFWSPQKAESNRLIFLNEKRNQISNEVGPVNFFGFDLNFA